jgi:hypothetical protein
MISQLDGEVHVHVSVQRYMYPYAPDTRTAVQGGVQCKWTQPCTAVYVRALTYTGYPARNAARMYTVYPAPRPRQPNPALGGQGPGP